MSLSAQVRVYDVTGATLLHTFAHGDLLNLTWSDEVGGGGGCSFAVPTTLMPSADLLDDCVVKIGIVRASGMTEEVAYAVRGCTEVLTV
ncbi:MAG: hypothetical protein WCF04_01010, partial [Candidatus Nanopelagicales bacterium]